MKQLIFTIAALSIFGSAALAHPGHDHKNGKSHGKQAVLICPVTGTKVASVKSAAGHSTYKGKTYYFCCGDCKLRFDKDPAKFVKNAAAGKFEKM